MTKWTDNALYRGMLAGVLTLFLGPYILLPALIPLVKEPVHRILPIYVLAPLVGLFVAWRSRRHDRPDEWSESGRCRSCGYDLTGNITGRCPECGTSARSPEPRTRH